MPRKGQAPHREVGPEPMYNSVIVHRLVNKVMERGKKSLAEHVVYTAFDQIKERSGQDPVKVLDKALHNVMPVLEVRPRRVGGATYQVPDRKSTRLNSSHRCISYAVFCLKKKTTTGTRRTSCDDRG